MYIFKCVVQDGCTLDTFIISMYICTITYDSGHLVSTHNWKPLNCVLCYKHRWVMFITLTFIQFGLFLLTCKPCKLVPKSPTYLLYSSIQFKIDINYDQMWWCNVTFKMYTRLGLPIRIKWGISAQVLSSVSSL